MKAKVFLKLFVIFFINGLLVINSYPQVVERNGILYRDFQFRSDSLNPDHILKSENNLITANEDSLPFIKNNFIVNSFDGEYGADQNRVCGAMDGNGNYAFTWIDYRSGQKEIYAQFYNSDDIKIGQNFRVNEYPLYGNNSPFISANENGDFVIVWLESFQEVFAQRFTKDGQKVGNNIVVNTISGWNTSEPSVAVNSDGSFMVMWASQSGSGNYQVYARLLDSSGNPVGQDILVTDTSLGLSSIGRDRSIDIDGFGKYCLTWSSYSSTNFSRIYLQIINSSGQMQGSNILVSSPTDSSQNYFPDIASTDDGHFLITWEKDFDYPFGDGGGVGGRIYNPNGYFETDDFVIYNHPYSSWNPVNVAADRDSIFIVLWLGDGGQYLQKIKSNGEFIGDKVKVIYNSINPEYSYYSGLTNMFNNHFFIAPELYERHDQNIYLQKFNSELQPVGSFNKLHDDFGSASQRKSLVKFNHFGESIVLWEDQRNGRFDLYAQVYDELFNTIGNNIQINETDADYWFLYDKEVQSLADGTFVIAFSREADYYTGSTVFIQLVSNSGEKIGQNKLVKEGTSYFDYNIALNVNSEDEILICWYNSDGASIKIYDKNLNIVVPEKTLLQSSNNIGFYPITVSVDSLFSILTVWTNYDFQNYSRDNKIRGKFFNQDGNASSSGFVIDSVNSYVTNFTCKNDGNNFALLYKDGSKIYLKIL